MWSLNKELDSVSSSRHPVRTIQHEGNMSNGTRQQLCRVATCSRKVGWRSWELVRSEQLQLMTIDQRILVWQSGIDPRWKINYGW
jgi:hypothetical protein